MKELVCVAPDGSFEVWVKGINHFGENIYQIHIHDEMYSFFISSGSHMSPEFWGRKVLGEL